MLAVDQKRTRRTRSMKMGTMKGLIILACMGCLLVGGFFLGVLIPVSKTVPTLKTASATMVEQRDGPFTVDSIGFFEGLKAQGWTLSHYRDSGTWRIMVFVNDNMTIQYEEKSWDALIKDLKETKWPER
jgi:hypothetical protein